MDSDIMPGLRSHDFARERDARICWLLDQHPVTAALLVRIGWFPSKYKALKRLRRLVDRRRVRLVGTVCRKPGRPEHVYCRYAPKADHLLHEVELTEFCFRLHAGKILRGPHVLAAERRPDAEVWINDDLYYLEWDRGTMSYGQLVRDRFPRYEDCPALVLWVCQTELRCDALRRRAERIKHVALFATARDALLSPHREIWLDWRGEKATLPCQQESVGKKAPF